jgi:hypothetical protein
MNRRNTLAGLALSTTALLLGGCAAVSKVATGEVVMKDRLVLTVDKPWNQFERGLGDNTPTWTQEGITVDALRFYVALKDGDLIAPTPSQPKGAQPLAFKAGMGPQQVAKLFEGLYARDGSSFTLDRIEPAPFAGQPGFRFEFSSVRKSDDVRLRGLAWGAVRNGELFLISYTAPQLAFFPRGRADAEAIARSARLRG